MRFLVTLFLLLFLSAPCFALDSVQYKGNIVDGRIKTFTEGLIIITDHGTERTIIREKKKDYFGDFIQFRSNPLRSKTVDIYCRVAFIDGLTIIYETPKERVTIPRYRVTRVILDAN